MYNNQIKLQKYFNCIEMYITFAFMKGVKEKKKLQILIHDIDENVYSAIIRLAEEEKRSVGKQAEYLIMKQIEKLQKEKK